MTITEANALNKVLAYWLRLPKGSSATAKTAAMWLADRARTAIGAGLDGADINLRWRDLEDLVEDEAKALLEIDMEVTP